MRIVQVAPFFHPHAGGVESHVRQLARELAREGHEVTVLTSQYDPSLPLSEVAEGYRVVRTPTRGVLLNTPMDFHVGRALRSIPADVVHLHYPPPVTPYFAARAMRRTRTPLVITYHCDLYLPGPGGRLLTEIYQRIFLPSVLSRADRIVVHTESYGRTSAVLRDRRLEIVPSLVDVARFQDLPDLSGLRRSLGLEGKRVLAFTGRLVLHKGIDTILRALAQLPPETVLLVIGRGPRLGALAATARRLGVGPRVRFLTSVSDDELPSYLALAEVFVFPSQSRLEGFGLAVAEAMAAGLPVVIADMPGVREVIEPGREGLLAEPLLAEDFARRIRDLLQDGELRRRMGAAGRRRAEERYGLVPVTTALVGLYAGLVSPN